MNWKKDYPFEFTSYFECQYRGMKGKWKTLNINKIYLKRGDDYEWETYEF